MLRIVKITAFLIILAISFNKVFAADIPIIVIAPSKKAQSISTVGSSTTVYDELYIDNTNDFFQGMHLEK